MYNGQSFTYRGKKFSVLLVEGPVLSTDKRSETTVSGGGHVSRGQGSVSVSSKVTRYHDFWQRDQENGNEMSFRVIDQDFPLRADQQVVSIIFRNESSKKKKQALVGLKNLTINRNYKLVSNRQLKLLKLINFSFTLTSILMGIGIGMLLSWLSATIAQMENLMWIVAPLLIPASGVILWNVRARRMRKALKLKVEDAFQQPNLQD